MILKSILDNDLYKFTMQKAVLAYRQNLPARYTFINRRPEGKFTNDFQQRLLEEIGSMSELRLADDEANWLNMSIPFLGHPYVEYLRNYRYDPNEVNAKVVNGELAIEINGPWERTILWEVPLMALVSELYFQHCETNWGAKQAITTVAQYDRLKEKAEVLKDCTFADFGTRRRRNYATQDLVVNSLRHIHKNFIGTSNVHLAHKYNVKAIGTMAHEWIMGISVLESLRHANRYALRIWSDIFDGRLGIALTDTFGTDAFFEDFDGYLARLFDGVRHDSGCPFGFARKAIAHYEKLGIHPNTKNVVFSDGLNPELAARLQQEFGHVIRVSFGIGTNLTNDFVGSPALNMVIKLASIAGVPVVKLSDVPTKAIGDRDALRVARWVFRKEALDAQAA